MDWEGINVESNDDATIDVPDTPCPLNLMEFEELMRLVPPLSESTHYGIDLYEEVFDYVSRACHHIM